MDEPHLPRHPCAGGLHLHRPQRKLRVLRDGEPRKRIYAVQFHPEVTHSEEGQKVIANFLYNVCGCTGDWTMSTFIDNAIASIREQVGPNGRVMLGLSGGVDSPSRRR